MNEFLKKLHEVYLKESKETVSYEDFVKKIKEEDNSVLKEAVMKMQTTIELFQKKRRGEEVSESFEKIENDFMENVKVLIEGKDSLLLEETYNKPFAKELFEKYTNVNTADSKIIVTMKEQKKEFHDFVLFKQWWRPKFTEGKSLDRYILTTSKGLNIYIDNNIFTDTSIKESVSMYLMPTKDIIGKIKEGVELIRPKTKDLNDTLMPCWIKFLGSGKLCINESNNGMTIEFDSSEINGIFRAVKNSENSDFWKINKIS